MPGTDNFDLAGLHESFTPDLPTRARSPVNTRSFSSSIMDPRGKADQIHPGSVAGGRASLEPCWTITDGSAGMESQCRGVAAALGVTPVVKQVRRRGLQKVLPLHWLPPSWFVDPAAGISPPWPALVISCGYTAAGYALAVKRLGGGHTRAVHIQDPRMPLHLFDLVAAPAHDGISGGNVVQTHGAIHDVTPARLLAGAQRFGSDLSRLPRPLVAVLVGGPRRNFRFGMHEAETLAVQLEEVSRRYAAGLAITVSRRTGSTATEILRRRLGANPAVRLWDGRGENPYLGFLGSADAVIATADSVSMVSEACATGKPVYVAGIDQLGSAPLRRFLEDFLAAGLVRPFDGRLDPWEYTPLDEAGKVAGEIRRRFPGQHI